MFIASVFSAKRAPSFEDIRIAIVTWNVGNAPPPDGGCASCLPSGMDIYYVCVQECEYGGTNTNVEADIFNYFHKQVGDGYIRLAALSLLYIRVIVLIKAVHRWKVTHVQTSKCATGIANLIGNKGGVGVSFEYNNTKLCFVGSHLAAHVERLPTRIENFIDITQKLKLKGDGELTSLHDHLFWCGDLNFRIEEDRDEALRLVEKKRWDMLIEKDQLASCRKLGTCFHGFNEGEIDFPPTYRYNRGDRTYSEEKMRVPSYCDRVLWRSLPAFGPESVELEKYVSCDDVMSSDHSPVLSVFRVRTLLPPPPTPKSSKTCRVTILVAGVNLNTLKSGDKAEIQFWGDWIDDPRSRITVPLTSFLQQRHSFQPDLPNFGDHQNFFSTTGTLSFLPVISSRDFLISQHLFFSVRSEKTNTLKQTWMVPLGEGSLPLQSAMDQHGSIVVKDIDLMSRGCKEGTAFVKISIVWSDTQPQRCPGNVLKQGYLLKQGGARKNWKRRWFVLEKHSRFSYYDTKEGYMAGSQPLNSVVIRDSVINDKGTGRQNLIILETKKRTFYMCGDSHAAKVAWVESLQEAGAKLK